MDYIWVSLADVQWRKPPLKFIIIMALLRGEDIFGLSIKNALFFTLNFTIIN